MKCETGYYFAYKNKDWNVTELNMPDGGICLVKDYVSPKSEEVKLKDNETLPDNK